MEPMKGATLDDAELGSRIAYWRRRRGVTQRLLADRIGRSKSWLEKVEAGTRSANRLPVLLAICQELRLDLPVLLGRDPQRDTRDCIDELQVETIRASLERYDAIENEIPDGDIADLAKLRAQVSYVWSAFELTSYEVVSAAVPGLLLDAQRAHAVRDSDETARILVEVYQIAASTLRKLGEYDLAWLAGDRGFAVAERKGDLTMSALTGFRIANALTALGRWRAAFDLNLSLASRVEPHLSTGSDMSVYGNLLLQAAMAAASGGDAAGVRDLVREARTVAARVPDDANHYRLSFGPANVGIHHVSALVSQGEGGLAVEVAATIDEAGLRALRRERRANHLVDVARGYGQWGLRGDALNVLCRAEALAPRKVYCRPAARSLIGNLMERASGRPSSALLGLAGRAGVTR
jgi:transcriptional regulator with XRE-family HTH domain